MLRRTHETAIARGVYQSACKCRTEIRVRPGDRFPECPMCRQSVLWHYTRSTFEGLPPPPPSPAEPTAD